MHLCTVSIGSRADASYARFMIGVTIIMYLEVLGMKLFRKEFVLQLTEKIAFLLLKRVAW